jgi:hypothetical protein
LRKSQFFERIFEIFILFFYYYYYYFIIYIYILINYLNMWAGPSTGPKTGGLALAQKGWAELGPTYCFLNLGTGWARTGPAQSNLVTGSLVTKLHKRVQREL